MHQDILKGLTWKLHIMAAIERDRAQRSTEHSAVFNERAETLLRAARVLDELVDDDELGAILSDNQTEALLNEVGVHP